MSKEQAKGFFHEAVNNKNLAEDIRRIVEEGSSNPKAAADKLISLAKEYGFEFTVEEAAEHSKNLHLLSDEELSNVVGGFGFFTGLIGSMVSIFTTVIPMFTGVFSSASSMPPPTNEVVVTQAVEQFDNTTANSNLNAAMEQVEEDRVKEEVEKDEKVEKSKENNEDASAEDVKQFMKKGWDKVKEEVMNKKLGLSDVLSVSSKIQDELTKKQKEAKEEEGKAKAKKESAVTEEEKIAADTELARIKKEKDDISKMKRLDREERKDAEIKHAISSPEKLSVYEFLETWESASRRPINKASRNNAKKLSKSFEENLKKCDVHFESQYNGFTLNYGVEEYHSGEKHYIFIDGQEGENRKSLDKETVKALFGDLTSKLTNDQSITLLIGPKIIEIGEEAFKVDASAANKIMLHTVRVFSRLHSIGAEAFAGNTNLRNFSIEYDKRNDKSRCYSIGDSAFKGCKNLSKIKLERMSTVGKSAFKGCSSLSAVYLPQVKEIGESAFSNCESLEFFNVSEEDQCAKEHCEFNLKGVTHIGKWAFKNNNAVTKVLIPDNLEFLGYAAFSNCEYLEDRELIKSENPTNLNLHEAF